MGERIQRRRVRGWRMPEGAVYVGRGSMWGNPFAHRDSAIAARMFRVWLTGSCRTGNLLDCRKVLPGPLGQYQAEMRRQLPLLRGKTLACWCRPGAHCHGDVLLAIANAEGRADAG